MPFAILNEGLSPSGPLATDQWAIINCAVVSLLCERCMRFHRRVHHERVAADE